MGNVSIHNMGINITRELMKKICFVWNLRFLFSLDMLIVLFVSSIVLGPWFLFLIHFNMLHCQITLLSTSPCKPEFKIIETMKQIFFFVVCKINLFLSIVCVVERFSPLGLGWYSAIYLVYKLVGLWVLSHSGDV